MTLVAGIAIADPDLSLREIAAQSTGCASARRAAAASGGDSSVKALLDQAPAPLGLAQADAPALRP